MKKRILSIIMAIVMLVSSCPVVMANAGVQQSNGQVTYQGGSTVKEGIIGNGANDIVTVSKTIEETDVENYFDITLTSQIEQSAPKKQPVDIVVVFDISNSMNSASKLTYAKAALSSFISDYNSFITNGKIASGSRLGVVTFNTHANVAIDMTAVTDSTTATMKSTVSEITAPDHLTEKYTNIEGGLQLADNILHTSTAEHKYIILITDGFPTTHINTTISGNASSTTTVKGFINRMDQVSGLKIGDDGYFYDAVVNNRPCTYGVSYSDISAQKTQDTAANIKEDGTNIFSVGVQLDSQSVDTYVNQTSGKTHSVVDRRSTDYVVGNSADDYRNWLENSIAGGPDLTGDAPHYSDGENEAGLGEAFDNILESINSLTTATTFSAYVSDPMSEGVEFMYFYDKDGNAADSLTGESKLNKENTAVFNSATSGNNGTINWDIIKSGFTKDDEGRFVYTLKYRVRLKNEITGFVPSTDVLTNNATYFNYVSKYGNGEIAESDAIEHKIPKVEGYLGTLTFNKADADTNAAIEGTTFTLTHRGTSCSVCGGDATISAFNATSDANGVVTFNNIPSGHDYVLEETQSADGYYASQQYKVSVYYGTATLYDSNGNAVDTITNQKLAPAAAKLNTIKTYDKLQENQFDYTLVSATDPSGNPNPAPFNNINYSDKNDSVGNGSFDQLNFDQPGTYYFTVKEIQGTNSSIIYDDTVYDAKVEVVLKESSIANPNGLGVIKTQWLEAQISINQGDGWQAVTDYGTFVEYTLPFVSRDRESGQATITAVKNTFATNANSATPAKDGYVFHLKDENGTIIETQISDSNGNVAFTPISYNTEGTYLYTVVEDATKIYDSQQDAFVDVTSDEIVFSKEVYSVTVDVNPPADDSAFVTTVTYKNSNGSTVDSASFDNYERKNAQLKIIGGKTLDNQTAPGYAYSFTIEQVDKVFEQTVANSPKGEIVFNTIEYDQSGQSYHYTISEKDLTDQTILKDSTVYHIYVTTSAPADSMNYELDVTVKKSVNGGSLQDVYQTSGNDITLDSSIIKFANKTRESASISIDASKYLDGNVSNTAFLFAVYNEEGYKIDQASNTGSTIDFSDLVFTEPGTYTYTVKEIAGTDKSIVYDQNEYQVTVVVSPNATEAKYDTLVTYTLNGNQVDGIVFNNTTRTPARVKLVGEKYLDQATTNKTFTFVLKDSSNQIVSTTTNSGNQFAFDQLVFEKPGDYYYTITEVKGTDDSIYYDSGVYAVNIYVTPDLTDTDYNVDIKIYRSGTLVDDVVFNNYTRTPAKVDILGTKTLDGATPSQTFTFALADAETNQVIATTTNNGKDFEFSNITYTHPGTYNYKVYEIKGDDTCIFYDKSEYTVTVTVSPKENEASYSTTVAYYKNTASVSLAAFYNYTRPATEYIIEASKLLDGVAPTDQSFVFELKNEQGQVIDTKTNYKDSIAFDKLVFDGAGTYTYTVSEQKGSDSSYFYDSTVYDVIIQVTPNENYAKYDVTEIVECNSTVVSDKVFNNITRSSVGAVIEATKLFDGANATTSDFSFTLADDNGVVIETVKNNNEKITFSQLDFSKEGTYVYTVKEVKGSNQSIVYDDTVYTVIIDVTPKADSAGYNIDIKYEIDGQPADEIVFENITRTPAKVNLEATKYLDSQAPEGLFSFVLKDSEGAIVEAVNNSASSVSFSTLTFDKVGTYTYTISEIPNDDPSIVYDSNVYDVTVKISPNGQTPTYIVDIEYSLNGEPCEAVFNNITRKASSIGFSATKLLDDGAPNTEFTFAVEDESGVIVQTANNVADIIDFTELSFNKVGTYVYKIYEIANEDPSIVYDDTVYEMTIVATPHPTLATYALSKSYSLNGQPVDQIVFSNVTRTPVTVDLSATKYLDQIIPEKEFTFAIADEEGTVIEQVTNVGENVTFSSLSFDKVGTYTYTVYEIESEDQTIAYDANVYTVVITVTPNAESATYDAVTEIKLADDVVEQMVFNNTTRQGVNVVINAQTTLDGKTPNMDFNFWIEDSEGNVIDTVVNEKGEIEFADITYNQPGEYVYTIHQKPTGDGDIIFDQAVYQIVVKVTPSADEPTYDTEIIITKDGQPADNVVFENITVQKDNGDKSPNTGGISVLVGSGFMLSALALVAIAKKEQDKISK